MIKYFERDETARRADAYLLLSRLLLRTTALQTDESGGFAYDKLISDMAALHARLEPCRSAAELMPIAQAFTRVLQRHRERTNGADSGRGSEFAAIMDTVSEAVSELDELKVIAVRAARRDGVPVTKAPEALKVAEAEPAVEAEPVKASPIREAPRGREGHDSVTGLMWRQSAVDAIADYGGERTHLYAVVFMMDGYQAFNRCHGPEAADHALQVLCHELKPGFLPQDRFFRWSAETLAGLIVRPGPATEVRSMVRGIGLKRFEATVLKGARAVHLPIKCVSVSMSSATPDPADLVAKIDDFVARRLSV